MKEDHTYHNPNVFELELGGFLPGFQLRYSTLGRLNQERSNVVWVCHALTGSSDFTAWWGDLFTDRGPFDPRKYFIICANVLGGCYGSTGPLSVNPRTGTQFFKTFPDVTNRDVVRAFEFLRLELGITRIHTLIGGSLGGQQVLEWGIYRPDIFDHLIPVACNAFHSAWGIALNEAQRMAIQADSTWDERDERAGLEGLKAARAIGILSYRGYETFAETQYEVTPDVTDDFRAATYMSYQVKKLANRFNAFSYWVLTKMMDSHHVARGRTNVKEALELIEARTLVIGIASDILFPIAEQKLLKKHILDAKLEIITSLYGHDGFLVESEQVRSSISKFYQEKKEKIWA